jgi:hypothetical protein
MKIYILLISLLLLTACTAVVEETTPTTTGSLENIQLTIHTVEKPFGDKECPFQLQESYIDVKMDKIISGNISIDEKIGCSPTQIRTCTGYFDVTGESNNKCWILECEVSTPSKMQNNPIETVEKLPCDFIKIRDEQNTIDLTKELSWEII